MQVVILAAGRGTRMGSLTKETPKPILKLAGKPLLAHKLENLPDVITEVVLVVGHGDLFIRDLFKTHNKGRSITYVQQEELNGTYGALAIARDVLRDTFMVLMGDDLYHRDDLEKLALSCPSFLGSRSRKVHSGGIIETNAKGELVSIRETKDAKPNSLINCGAYMLDHSIFSVPPVKLPNGEYGLPQTLVQLMKYRTIKVVETNNWYQISSPKDLKHAEKIISRFYNV